MSATIVPRLREIRAKNLDLAEYARAITALAEEQFGVRSTYDGQGSLMPDMEDLPEFVVIAELEGRLRALESRVAELEAHK